MVSKAYAMLRTMGLAYAQTPAPCCVTPGRMGWGAVICSR